MLELPWSGWIADDGPEPAIARGLTAMIMDHVLGFAISLGRPNFPPSTTIDLRIDWSRPLIAGAPARVNVDGLFGEGDVILAVGSLWQNMGDSPCAIGTGRFLSGVYPGRQSARADSEIPAPLAMPEGPASFSRFLGLESLSGGRFILPGVPRLAGQVHVGAFHGGGHCGRLGTRGASYPQRLVPERTGTLRDSGNRIHAAGLHGSRYSFDRRGPARRSEHGLCGN